MCLYHIENATINTRIIIYETNTSTIRFQVLFSVLLWSEIAAQRYYFNLNVLGVLLRIELG